MLALRHYFSLSFADCRVNRRPVLHIVRHRYPIIHLLLMPAYVMLQSCFTDTAHSCLFIFVNVPANVHCRWGRRRRVDIMFGDRRYVHLTTKRRLCVLFNTHKTSLQIGFVLLFTFFGMPYCNGLTSNTGYSTRLVAMFHSLLYAVCVYLNIFLCK